MLGALAPELLAEASAAHVLEQTDEPGWRGADVALVLAAHGTVLNPATPIDTGLDATEALRQAIADRLAPHFGMVVNGWLNHTRGGKWTEPPIEEALADVQGAGYSRVVYYPYGFLADNAESELEGRVALAGVPSVASRHLPCLNDTTRLVDLVARQVLNCSTVCHVPWTAARDTSPAVDESGCYRLCAPTPSARQPCAVCATPLQRPTASQAGGRRDSRVA